MVDSLRTAWKALLAFLGSLVAVTVTGIRNGEIPFEPNNVAWWLNYLVLPAGVAFLVYWKKNLPGSFSNPKLPIDGIEVFRENEIPDEEYDNLTAERDADSPLYGPQSQDH